MTEHIWEGEPHHRTIVVVDVARFTDPTRTELHQRTVHEGLYDVLSKAFDESGVHWKECRIEDRGDGAIILVRPEFPKGWLVDQMPARLLAGLRRYNARHAAEARVQLRVALNSGEVHLNDHGIVSQALNLACRVVDAPPAKNALERTGALLALITTDAFYQDVVRQDPAAEPAAYRRIAVSVKQTNATAWLRLPDCALPEDPAALAAPRRAPDLFELVDALLAVPVVSDDRSRQQLISLLRPEIAGAVPYDSHGRMHVLSLVRTCERYAGGLAELVTAIRALDGDSLSVRRVEELVRDRD
ncbi:effector-associated domain 2-containing protein [Amycolatopsis anabasis]|uniref:effector-associated domain 2-containing protein n=1 Tax=Amycolatopsis anabasis TaxID=1840409 RepID=UPI001FEC33C3|nr:hypothetical protein [Amycolatopsis anabasis]